MEALRPVAQPSPSLLTRASLVAVGLGLLALAWVWQALPTPGPARIEAAPEVVGLYDGHAYAWVVRTPHGALLVDTGGDAGGDRLLAELRSQGLTPDDVHTVLLTHGHVDHWAAAHLFRKARVLAGPGEAAVVRGQRLLKSPLGRALELAGPRPPVPLALEELRGDETLTLDGETVRVVPLPGVTPGSVGFLWRDLLFTGDALVGGGRRERLRVLPAAFYEDAPRGRRSLEALLALPFTRVADGHTGLTADARRLLRALLER